MALDGTMTAVLQTCWCQLPSTVQHSHATCNAGYARWSSVTVELTPQVCTGQTDSVHAIAG